MKEVLSGKYVDNLLAVARKSTDPAKAYDKALRAKNLGQSLNDLGLQAHADLLLCEILTSNSAYEQALEYCSAALAFFSKTRQDTFIIKCWRSMAIIYGRLGLREEQLIYNNKCLQLLKTTDNPKEELRVQNNIGNCYAELGRSEEAIEVFESILFDDRASDWLLCAVFKNLAAAHHELNHHEKSRLYAEEGHALSVLMNHEAMISANIYFIALSHFDNEQYEEAHSKLLEALSYFDTAPGTSVYLGTVLEALIQTLLKQGRLEELQQRFEEFCEHQKQAKALHFRKAAQSAKFQIEITEIAKRSKQLAASNDRLQAANEQLALRQRQIDQKARWLELVNGDLHSYAHTVAHDLRQPIRTIKGFATLLSESLVDKVTGDERKWLEFLNNATDQMNQFVGDLLEFAEAGGKLPKVRVDVPLVLKQVLLNLESQIQEKGGQIHIGATPDLHSNSTLILQVFQNLISNALKFHKPGEVPVIHIDGLRKEGRVIYKVRDNGIGIQESKQQSIFELFSRLEETIDQEGSGIGLATVWRLIKQTGGHLELESRYGEGTCFSLWF